MVEGDYAVEVGAKLVEGVDFLNVVDRGGGESPGEYIQTLCGITAVTAAHTWAGLSRRNLYVGGSVQTKASVVIIGGTKSYVPS